MNCPLAVTILLLKILATYAKEEGFLAAENGTLRLNGEKVFLSGMNIAWNNYGNDFGNGQYDCCTGTQLEKYIRLISSEGGNSLRIWLHINAWATPTFDSNDYVTGTDTQGTMISDLSRFLDVAYSNNILVFIVLWNGSYAPNSRLIDLIWDESKLQTYIDNALIPMVRALKRKVSLGGWEIMSKPEGLVYTGVSNSNPCFDTMPLKGSGAGWVNTFIPMKLLLRFINRQSAAIKRTDPKVIVTLGSWSERAQTDQFGYRNYYTDTCLIAGGGDALGLIDLQQMHAFAWQGSYSSTCPLLIPNSSYNLKKPNLIGAFSQIEGDGRSIIDQFEWAYTKGYCGAWSWQANGFSGSDNFSTQALGLNHLRGRNDPSAGGRVGIILQDSNHSVTITSLANGTKATSHSGATVTQIYSTTANPITMTRHVHNVTSTGAVRLVSTAKVFTRYLAAENGTLRLNGEKVFLSGMNIAWNNYGYDFGNGQYNCCTGTNLEKYIRLISSEGGNSLRVWLHCDARSTPAFDSNGYVTGTDRQKTMISDLSRFLDVAYSNNVLVFIVLWNGATAPNAQLADLIRDESKLQTYIDNALIPMVRALSQKVSLGGWEIMNEPEGLVASGVSDSNPCFDTMPLKQSGAGWTNTLISMKLLLRFINRQSAAIKRTDSKVIVTVGSAFEHAQTDQFGYRNYYTDTCLIAGGGDDLGLIDFQQMHSYSWQGSYSSTSPLLVPNSSYNLKKPNLLGEFSQIGGDGRRTIIDQFEWAYTKGYCGAWSWQACGQGGGSDNFSTQALGLNHLRGRNDPNAGGRVAIILQ